MLREKVPDAWSPWISPSTCVTPPVSRALSNEKDPFWIEAAPSRIELERTSPSAQGARHSKLSCTTALDVVAKTKGRPCSVVPLNVVVSEGPGEPRCAIRRPLGLPNELVGEEDEPVTDGLRIDEAHRLLFAGLAEKALTRPEHDWEDDHPQLVNQVMRD